MQLPILFELDNRVIYDPAGALRRSVIMAGKKWRVIPGDLGTVIFSRPIRVRRCKLSLLQVRFDRHGLTYPQPFLSTDITLEEAK